MRLTCARADLIAALSTLSRIVERRTTIPILSYILFESDGANARLRGTDLDIECAAALPLRSGSVDIACAAPAHLLHEIARRLPEKSDVTLSLEQPGGDLTISSGRMRAALHTLSPDDYARTPGPQDPVRCDMPARALEHLFGKASFAMSTEETRYYLNGIYFHTIINADGPSLRAVATDGHRLARVDAAAPQGAQFQGVILPRKAVGEIIRLAAAAGDAHVAVEIEPGSARFGFGGVELTTRTIDGTFPDYARVIPTGNDRRVELPRAPFLASVERVATIASERGHAIKLAFADDVLRLRALNTDMGEAVDEIDIAWSGAPLEIGFNSKYLADILSKLDGPNIVLRMGDSGAPTLIADTSDDSTLIILMPRRV